MTRISTAQSIQQSIDAITSRQAKMNHLQQQISSGDRLIQASDDPVAASQAEQTRSSIGRIEIESRMVDFARLKLEQAEGAMGNGVEILQRSREILLAANNDTYSVGERRMHAVELQGLRDELFSTANRSDGLGAYVFGGAGTRNQPFVESAAGVQYVADGGNQTTGQEYKFYTSIDGADVFNSAPGPSGLQSVFTSLDTVIGQLNDENIASDDLHAGVKLAIDGIDGSMDKFNSARAEVGEHLSATERAQQNLETGKHNAQGRLSDLVDIDFAEAISSLAQQQTQLDASMKTYAQISGLSLFNYIR